MTDPVPVSIENPLSVPYRTGSYLISDYNSTGLANFRSAMALTDHPYRASGSHQLGIIDWVTVLGNEVVEAYRPQTLHLVDLRQETHGYFDGAPVSWYADNDFGNVGMDADLLVAEESARLWSYEGKTAQIFTIADDAKDDLQQERVIPVSYTEERISRVRDEHNVARELESIFAPTRVAYTRIPVTDHCAPSPEALAQLRSLPVGRDDWFHFHCHGGDGRTSTFLALWDMLRWQQLNLSIANGVAEGAEVRLPPVEEFAARQCQLFPYCLDPAGCANCGKPEAQWKQSLAAVRWEVISKFHDSLRSTYSGSSRSQKGSG